jgi:hypothetical protein
LNPASAGKSLRRNAVSGAQEYSTWKSLPQLGCRIAQPLHIHKVVTIRELLNIFEADAVGCQIITATNDIIKKLSLVNYDLQKYSLDTVKMFHSDALQAGYVVYTILGTNCQP